MSRTENISEAFAILRKTCDPRGLGLLQALENLCLSEAVALDALLAAIQDEAHERAAVVTNINRYSVKA